MAGRLFNAYVTVHWNAASKPATGAEGVWIGVLKRDVRFRLAFEAKNPATRAEAEKLLVAVLVERGHRRERTFVGFDFPLGFPRGLAKGLALAGERPWRAVWDQLAKMTTDKANNANNRFGVGSEINRRLTGGPFPFWGCPARDTLTTLGPKRTRPHGQGDIPEFRHAEIAARSPSPAWKLYFAGAVGGSAILGIPMVRRVKIAFGDRMAVWPFDTGWKTLTETDLAGVDVVAAEIATSLAAAPPQPGELKEAGQARVLCEHLARLDEAGRLGALFGHGKQIAESVVADAEREEGWILGV